MRRPARVLILGGILIAGVLGFVIYQGISNNLVYYITPSELLAKGAAAHGQSFRVGGQIRPGSVRWNPKTEVAQFILQDTSGAHVSVVSHGVPPEMFFTKGIGCVVEGTFGTHVFDATNLMIKHSADYRAPTAKGQAPSSDGYVHKGA
jgi:cytochrome c-type biogenesis protein CcmE